MRKLSKAGDVTRRGKTHPRPDNPALSSKPKKPSGRLSGPRLQLSPRPGLLFYSIRAKTRALRQTTPAPSFLPLKPPPLWLAGALVHSGTCPVFCIDTQAVFGHKNQSRTPNCPATSAFKDRYTSIFFQGGRDASNCGPSPQAGKTVCLRP